ncbi:tetratricopeptide repeat protein [Ferruginibacter sp. SUN106]|uniref:tetratricopeptide repeat protein n=1 Tax=Ferruginibacter sp. SUN106 TaxID=2978348 RepID=UPI003D36503F
MKYILLVFLSVINCTSYACLNEEHVTKSGKKTIDAITLRGLTFYKGQNTSEIQDKLKVLESLLSKTSNTTDDIRTIKNDIAVQYIKLGRLEEAEKMLLELQKEYPGNYSINVNLGTLYELQGKNEEALRLIKKSVDINPDSHEGSEWFHIKILEYKLKNIPEDKVAAQNILNLAEIKRPASTVADELSYQLVERIPFTPAPNIMMAKVLQEFADFLSDSVSIKAAYLIYEIGMDYDRNNILQLAQKRDALVPYFKKYHEVIPVLNNYYLDPVAQIIKDDPAKIASTVLEKGFNYFKDQEERRAAKERQKNIFIVLGISIAVLSGLFIYKRKKQTV